MLEEDLIEAIIALPTQLFYNTDIGIYIFILSRNKRPDRRGKVQLINAVDMWKPLRKSLGKKRREIDRDSMVKITELYSNFEENQYCKIFPNEEFMYKEYAVYQPLQRRGVLDAESIERLRTSSYFTSNSSIFNETDFEQLKEMNPRSAADEKKYQKYLAGQQFVADVLTILEANRSDRIFMDYSEFEKHLKSLLGTVEGMSASRLTGIAMVLAVMDKTAVVQKDRKGEIIKDTTTKAGPPLVFHQKGKGPLFPRQQLVDKLQGGGDDLIVGVGEAIGEALLHGDVRHMEHHIPGPQALCPLQIVPVLPQQRLPAQTAVYCGRPLQGAVFLLQRRPVPIPEVHPVVEENQVISLHQPSREIFRNSFSAPYGLNPITAQGMYLLLQICPVPILPQRLGIERQAHTLNHVTASSQCSPRHTRSAWTLIATGVRHSPAQQSRIHPVMGVSGAPFMVG